MTVSNIYDRAPTGRKISRPSISLQTAYHCGSRCLRSFLRGTELENGVPVPGLSGADGSEVFYQIEVPGGATNLQIQISGGTGDCDVYVRYGALPTTSEWDYRPYTAGNEETVTVSSPAAGSWYIMLRGYDPYSGVTLSGQY